MADTWSVPGYPVKQTNLTFGSGVLQQPIFNQVASLPMSQGPINSFLLGTPVPQGQTAQLPLYPLGVLIDQPSSVSPVSVAGTGGAGWGANAAVIADQLLARMQAPKAIQAGLFSSPAPASILGGSLPMMLIAGAAIIFLMVK